MVSDLKPLINDNGYKAANQYVIRTNTGTYFKSYWSVCARWYTDKKDGMKKLALSNDAFYSRTTMKHLLIFIRDFTDFKFSHPCEIREAVKMGIIPVFDNNFNPW